MKWDSDLETGIKDIDYHYKCLFDLANDLVNTASSGVNMRVVDILFSIVINFAYIHFETVESFLESVHHEDLGKYCQLHYRYLRQLNYYKTDFYNGREGETNLSTFIRDWMVDYVDESNLRALFSPELKEKLQTDETPDISESIEMERRKHKRLRADSVLFDEVVGHWVNMSTSQKGHMVVREFSSGGMKILSEERHDVDEVLLLNVNIGPKQKIKEKVLVKNIQGDMYGVEFISPADETVAFLDALCEDG